MPAGSSSRDIIVRSSRNKTKAPINRLFHTDGALGRPVRTVLPAGHPNVCRIAKTRTVTVRIASQLGMLRANSSPANAVAARTIALNRQAWLKTMGQSFDVGSLKHAIGGHRRGSHGHAPP